MLGPFHPKRIVLGMIATAFIITPAITEPEIFLTRVGDWLVSVQPYITEVIGGAI